MSTATLAMDDRTRFWSLAAVITHMLFIGLTLGISFPLTSLILEARDAPGWQIGLAGSMPALGILIIMPLAPRLVGRIGSIPAMCLGCVIGSIGLVLMPLLPQVEAWFVLRFLMGIGLALPWLVGETWINTVTREESRGRVGAPTDAVNARNHAAGRTLGRDIHDSHKYVDGIVFSSRLTGEDIFAIFDRAAPKLTSRKSERLEEHDELPDVLRRHDIRLIVRN